MTVSIGRGLAKLALGAVALAALPSAASAVSYNITSWGVDQTVSPSTNPLYGDITFKNAGGTTVTESAWVGRLFLTGTNSDTGLTQTLLTWCIDVFDNLQNGTFAQQNIYSLTTPTYTVDRLDNVVALMTHINADGVGAITTDVKSAAAQLAIWEILNEKSTNSWDVTGGDFKAGGGTLGSLSDVNGVYNTANGWLSDLKTQNWTKVAGQEVIMINPNDPSTYIKGGNASNQAQIYVTAVPEPASWMTMILGFGAVGWATRRRRVVGRAVG